VAEKRFQIWPKTGEIQCTSNVNQEDDIDKTIGRQEQIVLIDASDYVDKKGLESKLVAGDNIGGEQLPLIVGIGGAIAGIIAFITLRRGLR